MANKVVLHTPIKSEDIENLKIGDIVYLTGKITTCRDVAHRRLIEEGRKLPVDLEGGAIFHAGPIVRPIEGKENAYEMVSIGPTTSMRMEKFEKDFIPQTGVKLIVGKGGMGQDTMDACQKYKTIFCVFPAGCAVVNAVCVEETSGVEWSDLGMPEAVWVMKVKEFGPLIVTIDTEGNNYFENKKKEYNARKDEQAERITEEIARW